MHKSKAVLPVAYTFKNGEDATSSEDWVEPPLTANEYLARVRREAEAIPDLMLAQPSGEPSTAPSLPEGTDVSSMEGIAAGGSVAALMPLDGAKSHATETSRSMEQRPLDEAHSAWQAQTLAQFVQLRNALANRRAAMEEAGDDDFVSAGGRYYTVPQLRAAADWHYFCFGQAAPRALGSSGQGAAQGEASVAEVEEEEVPEEPDAECGAVDDDIMLDGSEQALDGGELESWEREAVDGKANATPEAAGAAAEVANTVRTNEAVESASPVSTTISRTDAAKDVDWSNGGLGHAPSVRLLLQLDAGTASTRVFAHHVRWLTYDVDALGTAASDAVNAQGSGANGVAGSALNASASSTAAPVPLVNRGRWLYALLARLPDPCHRDTLADVRTLYRTCATAYGRLRDDRPEDLSAKQALAVLLLIAGRHFNQAPFS